MKDEEVIKYLELMNDEIDFKKLGFVYANETLQRAIQKIKENSAEETLKKMEQMNEEEKKAIEDTKDLVNELDNHKDKDFIGRLYYKNKPIEENLKVLLNLIEKLQKENKELKETYKSEKKMKNEYVKLYQDLLLKENVIPNFINKAKEIK